MLYELSLAMRGASGRRRTVILVVASRDVESRPVASLNGADRVVARLREVDEHHRKAGRVVSRIVKHAGSCLAGGCTLDLDDRRLLDRIARQDLPVLDDASSIGVVDLCDPSSLLSRKGIGNSAQ